MLTAGYGTAAVMLPYLVAGARPSLPDIVAGGTLLACGFLLVDGGDRRLGRLVTLGGVAWFAPDYAPVLTEGAFRSVLEATSLAYLGFLTHAAVTVCDPQLARPTSRPVMVVGYGVAAAAATTLAQPGLLLLGVALGVTALDTARRPASAHLETLAGTATALALAAGLLLASGLRLASTPLTGRHLPDHGRRRDLAGGPLCGCLGTAGRRHHADHARRERVHGACHRGRQTERQGLVDVVFPAPDAGSWIDFAGLPVAFDGAGLMMVGDRGVPVAALLSRTPVPSFMVEDLTQLLRIAGERARLSCAIRRRTAEIASSRRRLVESEDEERRRLESALRKGAGASLDEGVRAIPMAPALADLRERGRATKAGLDSIAQGIDRLGGRALRDSLEDLATHAGVPVTIRVSHEPPPALARTIWFVCSEAVANVEKHAPGASVRISVDGAADPVRVTITDDGPGGADPDGSGLRGLAERASALDGQLTVTSTNRGTLVELVAPAGWGQ